MILRNYALAFLLSTVGCASSSVHAESNLEKAWHMIKKELVYMRDLAVEIPIPALTGIGACLAAYTVADKGLELFGPIRHGTAMNLITGAAICMGSLYTYYIAHRIAKILITASGGTYNNENFNAIAFVAALVTSALLPPFKNL